MMFLIANYFSNHWPMLNPSRAYLKVLNYNSTSKFPLYSAFLLHRILGKLTSQFRNFFHWCKISPEEYHSHCDVSGQIISPLREKESHLTKR